MSTTTTSLTDASSPTLVNNKQAGSAQRGEGIGVISFLTAVSSASAVFVIQLTIFVILRNKLARIFKPKTYLVPERQRIDPPPSSFWGMIRTLWNVSDQEIIYKCGLDAYFFLRYLNTLVVIFIPICSVFMPILISLNYINGIGSQLNVQEKDSVRRNSSTVTGLDTLAWGNVSPKNTSRYSGHLLLAILVVIWVCVVFFLELRVYIKVRQDYLTSAEHRLRASATTVLINSIPPRWLSEEALEGLFDFFPGGVRNIWLNRDLSKLLRKISRRNEIHLRLESAEMNLIKAANEVQVKRMKMTQMKKRKTLSKPPPDQVSALLEYPHTPVRFVSSTGSDYDGNGFMSKGGPRKGSTPDPVYPKEYTRQEESRARLPQGTKVLPMRGSVIREDTKRWQFWKPPSGFPSPKPRGTGHGNEVYRSTKLSLLQHLQKAYIFQRGPEGKDYPTSYNAHYQMEQRVDLWGKYLRKGDRPSHRPPLFGVTWLPGIPLINSKIDTIFWCRQELARLNLEIEVDQKHPEKFPLLNSAFIQFNNQVAAHMACQSAIYHFPKYMAPRTIEISPRDVIWANMSVSWWQEWLLMIAITGVLSTMVLLWSLPVAWTAAVGQLEQLIQTNTWLQFLSRRKLIENAIKAIAGVLPSLIISLLLYLVPLIFDSLAQLKGAKTGSQKIEFVQFFYFTFLFIQLFLVVSITSSFAASLDQLLDSVQKLQTGGDILDLLATNLPKGSNYFFSYMILQALSTSSSTLLQAPAIFRWYIISRLADSTPREKWLRNTKLNEIRWGAYFPIYTNFACIALVYCIIAPLISIFAIITFSLSWVSQRYMVLYVTRFDQDTGGVLYPRAINQTFTGIYTMELCIAGLLFLVKDEDGINTCTVHGIIMIIVLICTAIYQILLNWSFAPLFRYLPITLEDEAALRDEAFHRAHEYRSKLHRKKEEWGHQQELETRRGEALYNGINDEIEDLEPSVRNKLIHNAFQHEALRARRPTVWIPYDELGISDDEIRQTQTYSKYISICNEGAALDSGMRVTYERNPPDFSEEELINL
ncbi:putative DUF221 domain protein [Dactylonectria macrodidyma]|uniref:DUF221 domain protein n=1 Tax=Dactylonectria macrodidyma TaxID=307937 RepID=A0A9P9IDF3_9HYPO|nr:putative DUF221 domain protein [Dactylonectria macrodidyma]